jgi:hypothetical protein
MSCRPLLFLCCLLVQLFSLAQPISAREELAIAPVSITLVNPHSPTHAEENSKQSQLPGNRSCRCVKGVSYAKAVSFPRPN